MSKPIQSLDEDITSTLNKLHTILQYSTDSNADEVFILIEKAKLVWEGEQTESSWETD
jgi:hypothetical protein